MTHQEIEELVQTIDEYGTRLTKEEINFIANLVDNPPKQYSESQVKQLQHLYKRRVRRGRSEHDARMSERWG